MAVSIDAYSDTGVCTCTCTNSATCKRFSEWWHVACQLELAATLQAVDIQTTRLCVWDTLKLGLDVRVLAQYGMRPLMCVCMYIMNNS